MNLRSWAHPRSRGENAFTDLQPTLQAGSSPLTRGKRKALARGLGADGLIPAHAGKTQALDCTVAGEGAHPRSRGENSSSLNCHGLTPGSSPLTRGKRSHHGPGRPDRGLIPAHAGKTRSTRRRRSWLRAHPRSRGENSETAGSSSPGPGSSPLTRGKRSWRARTPRSRRLIPAHAGKTERRGRENRDPRAHPRSRGENAQQPPAVLCGGGSSPLTRGKRKQMRQCLALLGLIPAHAGKTRRRPARTSGCKAHPRSRGENTLTGRAGSVR